MSDYGECRTPGCCGVPLRCEWCGTGEGVTRIGPDYLCAACDVEIENRSTAGVLPTPGGPSQPVPPAAPLGDTFDDDIWWYQDSNGWWVAS